VPFHNLLADSQTDARSWILTPAMQSLEDDKYALEVFGVYANAIVTH
jgi:hypothetical protein